MNDPRPGTSHGHGNLLSGHFYRVVRRGPGAQQAIREPANLDELRNAVRTLLEGLEPGAFRLQSNAVTIIGTHDGEEVTVTVQHFVAQPTDVWATAYYRLKLLERHRRPGSPPARLARARPPPGHRRRLAGALDSYQEPRQPLDAEALEAADQVPGNLHLAHGEPLSDLLGAQPRTSIASKMRLARRALARRSSGLGRPRSAKTLPLLWVITPSSSLRLMTPTSPARPDAALSTARRRVAS